MGFSGTKSSSNGSLPPPYPEQPVRPYIGLRARLSQAWLNEYTVVLILIIVKLVLFQNSLGHALNSAEKYTMSSCESAQQLASSTASMPHYLAKSANSLIGRGMNASVSALISTVLLIVTGVEALIIFALDLWIGTYACLATATINGAAGTAINATESVISFVNDTLADVTTVLDKGLDGLSTAVNAVGGAAEDVADFFTGNDGDHNNDLKSINLSIDELKNLRIPSSINENLENLERNLPTYGSVKNSTENLIRLPFEKLKRQLNSTLQSELQFDDQHIEIPAKKSVRLCSEKPGIPEFFDGVQYHISLATKVCIIILIIAAVLICAPVVYREIRDWRWMKQCAEERAAVSDSRQDPMIAIHDSNNHMTVKIQDITANRFSSAHHKTLARWWVDYVLYRPALLTLLLALSGFTMVTLQYIVLDQVKRAAPKWQNQVQDMTTDISDVIKSEGIAWSNSTNNAISTKETDINTNVFGWVTTATESVNDTLTSFQSDMNKALKDTFDGTPLYKPISSVVYCVIGSKLKKVEQGLTWVHDHAKVSFPRIDDSYLTGQNASHEFDPDEIGRETAKLVGNALDSVIEIYEKSLHLELYISTVLFACWLIVAIMGLVHCWTRRNAPIIVTPVQSRSADNNDTGNPTSSWYIHTFQPPFLSTPGGSLPHTPVDPTDTRLNKTSFVEVKEKPSAAMAVEVEKSPPRKSVKGVKEFFTT